MKGTIAVFCALLVVSVSGITPTSIGYLGTSVSAPSATTTTFAVGQVITSVSQITSFTFFVSGGGGGTGTASIAQWDLNNNVPISTITSVSVTLPNTPSSYTGVIATLNVANLNPTKAYVIYFSFPASVAQQFTLATSANAATGAYVQSTNGYWSAGFNKDLVFGLASTNTFTPTYRSFSFGTGSNLNYNCYYNTSFTVLSANWQTNTLNTAYPGTTISYVGNVASCPAPGGSSTSMPLGTANTCYWNLFFFVVDLRGTNWAIADNWIPAGWPDDHNIAPVYSNNNQTVTGQVNGDCGSTNPAAAGEYGSFVGGFYIKIKYIGN